MADEKWSAKVRPELHPAAAKLVAIYEAVPGALTYPGCMPEALAKVLERMADELDALAEDIDEAEVSIYSPGDRLNQKAFLLRGEQP